MVKNKKNAIHKLKNEKPTNAVENENAVQKSSSHMKEEYAYDSMIDNGTSEEDSSNEAEDLQASDTSDEGNDNDDAFSECEEETAKSQKDPTKSGAANKRQLDSKAGDAKAAKKIKNSIEKVKPPSLEEINELKDTSNRFHSRPFRLQLEIMLKELKINEKYTNYISSWLEQFKAFTRKIEVQTEIENIHQMAWLRESALQVPIALKNLGITNQKPFQFQFVKPTSEPFLIGAAATQTLLKPKLVADICLPMPVECFQKENYLNLVYDQKRAYYLTYIGNEMLKSKAFEDVTSVEQLKFTYYANNPLKPVLEITPPSSAGSIASKVCIRIFIAAEESSFKLNRFVPWNNNVRPNLFDADAANDEAAVNPATPNYNANVLFDLTMQRNQRLLNEVFDDHKNLQEGLLLLKVWLKQRQLEVGYSAFSAHFMAMFIAHLLKQRTLKATMSTYYVARTVWNHLANSAWDETGISLALKSQSANSSNQPTLEQFHTNYDVVFIDASGFYNICANLSLEMYRRVRHEAKLAVAMLDDMQLNSFQLIFMTKCPLYSQFDHILKINKIDVIEQILEMHVSPADKCSNAGYVYPQLLKVVTNLLRKGLGTRVHTLLPIEQSTSAWPSKEPPQACANHLHLGIILNPEHAFEVLDKGPESIAEDAEQFRKFWGEKAQLRRFQDGSITESIVWAAQSDALSKKRIIVRSIVLHLLQHHFQLQTSKDVEYIGGDFDVVFKLTPAFKTGKLLEKYKIEQDTDSEAVSLKVICAFDDLARKLHGLNELPLEIVSIAGISPVFRYCEPEPVLPQARCINNQLYAMQVQRGVIQLGLSGKWPSELTALRALKTAFYIQIAKLLREKYHLHTKVTYEGVLVLKQGYCFALEMAHPKEVALLKREKTERGITQYVDCEASIALEKRHYVLPKVAGALHALYQLHPSFGPTVIIAKRWLYTQLIDDGLWPDECTELLVASQFLKTNAQQVSCAPQTGFIRFLQLLAHTDWKTELFLINFNNAMNENEIHVLEKRFNEERDAFPSLCIATAYDQKHYGVLWSTHSKPNVNVLARATILARQALAIIEPVLLSATEPFIKPSRIFTASNQGYDLVIQLKPDIVPNTAACEFGSTFVAFAKPNWRLPLADTNYMRGAVAQLREAYSDFAAFFYNPCGGKVIAVVWKPNVFAEKEFKVADVNGCALNTRKSSTSTKIQCKKEILIEDFKFILKDFYLRIGTVEAVLQASRESEQKFTANANANANTTSKKTSNRYFVKQIHGNANSLKQAPPRPKLPKQKLNKIKQKIQQNGNALSKNIAAKTKKLAKRKYTAGL